MRLTVAMLLTLALSGCATMTGSVETNKSVCAVWRDISWSKKDTDKTIEDVKINNARREGWCHDAK